jgi:hypothetical protein
MVIKFSLEMLETGYIELVKLLKATGVCPSGGMAKIAISEGKVRVDRLVDQAGTKSGVQREHDRGRVGPGGNEKASLRLPGRTR